MERKNLILPEGLARGLNKRVWTREEMEKASEELRLATEKDFRDIYRARAQSLVDAHYKVLD